MFTFKHPKYYKELRKLRNKSDQVISCGIRRRPSSGRAPGPGPKPQAASVKLSNQPSEASSSKLQALNNKPQASSQK